MKKWSFWFLTFLISLVNAGCFFGASVSAIKRGIDGVDNQGALLFIPLLWFIAFFVILGMNIFTLIKGIRLSKVQTISIAAFFHFLNLSAKAMAYRVIWIAVSCLLMVFGFSLFAQEIIWSLSYALSGGTLLQLLLIWKLLPAK